MYLYFSLFAHTFVANQQKYRTTFTYVIVICIHTYEVAKQGSKAFIKFSAMKGEHSERILAVR